MATFPLKVLTIDHCFFEGDVDRIVVRTTQGDVGILPNHVPYIAALGIGALIIVQNGERRVAAVSGGFVDVTREGTTILARTCEWADEIDVNRANSAAERARKRRATASTRWRRSSSKKRLTVSALQATSKSA